MPKLNLKKIVSKLFDAILSVPVRIKIIGIMVLPVIIMGWALNYWVQTGLSDWLSFLLDDERVRVAMQAGGRSVLFVSVLAAAGAIFLTLVLMYVLTQPLIELRQTVHTVAQGNLKSRARIRANDEIGEVAQSVNAMIDHLVTGNEDLLRTNRRLEALNRVAMAANLELEIHDVLYLILKNTIEVLGANTGWIYLYDPERGHYHLASWHGVPDEFKEALLFQAGDQPCSCMQALISGNLSPEAEIRACERLDPFRSHYPKRQHVTIKLEAREHQFGVVNFLCDEDCQPTEDDLELLSLIGSQISEIVANAWLLLKLSEKEVSRQALLSALVKAQEDERTRLARELHDGAGQNLTSLLVRLKMVEKQVPGDDLKGTVGDLCDSFSETIEYVRALSHQLRPIVLEELGLEIALQTLVEEMAEGSGLETSFRSNLAGHQFSTDIETTVYRITQEALTNVIRHAAAETVKIELLLLPRAVSLEVEDDGKGFDVNSAQGDEGRQRLGLLSMLERIEVLGGVMDVISALGEGTTVRVRIPRVDEV